MGDPTSTLVTRAFLVLLVLAAVVGVVVSLASWSFLELVYQIQQEVFVHLPHAVGYDSGPPVWWSLPVLLVAGVIVAVAIARLPGEGGHVPAEGLKVGGGLVQPVMLPGIVLAGLASIGLGVVIGPEAPLIALGAGLGVWLVRLARSDAPSQLVIVVAAAGSFAALSLVFSSPIIAAIILIEATGLGGARLPLVLLPGLVGAGIGTLVSIGMGSFTGLSTSAYALGSLPLPTFDRPTIGNFGWSIALGLAIAVVAFLIRSGGMEVQRFAKPRPFVLLPACGLLVGGLAILFYEVSGKSVNEVLFSGQSALPGLVSQAGAWSLGTLALLVVCKGIAYSLSLGSFRGGPTFPAIFLGAAGGMMASRLPGFPVTAAVAVGMGAGTVSILRLPLSAIVIASLLTSKAGPGAEPLVIVAVAVAYVATLKLASLQKQPEPEPGSGSAAPSSSGPAASASGASPPQPAT
jgi:H+/Cl- antiporter ClcA